MRVRVLHGQAPEVLLSSLNQGCPLDVWSVGIILLCLLTRRYPLLPGRSEEEQLHALLSLQRDSLRFAAATSLGKHIESLPFFGRADEIIGTVSSDAAAAVGTPDTAAHKACGLVSNFGGPATARLGALIGEARSAAPGVADALHLTMACLNPDPARRITAEAALRFHPFLTRSVAEGGAEVVTAMVSPHRPSVETRDEGEDISSSHFLDGVEEGASDFKAMLAELEKGGGAASAVWARDEDAGGDTAAQPLASRAAAAAGADDREVGDMSDADDDAPMDASDRRGRDSSSSM